MLICLGINHQSASAEQRAVCTLTVDQHIAAMEQLRQAGSAEVVWLATCNRNEIYATVDTDDAIATIYTTLNALRPGMGTLLREQGYCHRDVAAVRHLMRVATSLDSMVVGEPQILGQVKQAAAQSAELGLIGREWSQVIPHVLHVAKQVRSRTAIAERPVSISSIAVQLAQQIFEELSHCAVLVLGAGDMGSEAVRELRGAGVTNLQIANRTADRADRLAKDYAAQTCDWSAWPGELATVDILLSSVPTDAIAPYILSEAMVRATLAARRGRPLFLIDIAMPRGIAPAIANLPDVYLYCLDDLRTLADANRATRAEAVVAAEAMIEQALASYQDRTRPPLSEATIRALHQKCEQIRAAECEKTVARLNGHHTPADVQSAIDACSRAIVAKILHEPVMQLRQESFAQPDTDDGNPIHWLRRLFGLGE